VGRKDGRVAELQQLTLAEIKIYCRSSIHHNEYMEAEAVFRRSSASVYQKPKNKKRGSLGNKATRGHNTAL